MTDTAAPNWRATYSRRHRRVEIERPEPEPVRHPIGSPEWQRQLNVTLTSATTALAEMQERMRAHQTARLTRSDVGPVQ